MNLGVDGMVVVAKVENASVEEVVDDLMRAISGIHPELFPLYGSFRRCEGGFAYRQFSVMTDPNMPNASRIGGFVAVSSDGCCTVIKADQKTADALGLADAVKYLGYA